MTASWQCQGQRSLDEYPRDVPSEANRAIIIDAVLSTQDPQSHRPLAWLKPLMDVFQLNKSNSGQTFPCRSLASALTGPRHRQVTGRFPLYDDVMLLGWQGGQRRMEVPARLMLGRPFVSASLSFLSFSSLVR